MTTASAIMPQTIVLKPTKRDVDAGVCNAPTKCMYAVFLRRQFPRASYVAVNPNGVTITIAKHYYHYRIPKKTVVMMVEFDNGKKIDPAKAEVTVQMTDFRPCTYESTPDVKEQHRLRSARRRADPNYIRPDSWRTLRATVARSYRKKA